MRYGKYGNKKVTVDGIVFDSRKEATRYRELKLLQDAGEISGLQVQVPFELIPAKYEHFERFSEKTGKKLKDGCRCVEKSCVYYADFVYMDCRTGQQVVEDTKGHKTEAYIIKRKLMLAVHGVHIYET
ncbi:MAG: DUF1064 domain-containing protein [Peptococcaceae bacterium]|nr:DUF1064 domain-containing protein [Peptococcaceae bacterium]